MNKKVECFHATRSSVVQLIAMGHCGVKGDE